MYINGFDLGDAEQRLTRIRSLSAGEHTHHSSVVDFVNLLVNDSASEVRAAAALALGETKRCDYTVLYTLNVALLDPSPLVKEYSLLALHHCGPAAAFAVLNLLRCLNDHLPHIRTAAAWVIGELNAPPDFVLEALCDSLHDEDGSVRRQSAITLNRLNTLSIRVILSLENATHDRDDSVRTAAATTLQRLRRPQAHKRSV